MAKILEANEIDVSPTKEFFVDMITRDIPLEQAILDLVDNSVDGANRFKKEKGFELGSYIVAIEINADRFYLRDNCGGFDRDTAQHYAFRFGRDPKRPRNSHSIGQFGIGMKRALFKFGEEFSVRSATKKESWAVDVDVTEWKKLTSDWTFPLEDELPSDTLLADTAGTEIVVSELHEEVSSRFSTTVFISTIETAIRTNHREFIAAGLRISLNGRFLVATSLNLSMEGDLKPGVDELKFTKRGDLVTARIVVGVGPSSPKGAGWYVVCNGRVVLEADRSKKTGWGAFEDERTEIIIPRFHNQFARFRGIVWFDSEDAARVPWNTMKTDVDQENQVWQKTLARMLEMMRPVINFLNELDTDIDEHTLEGSALYRYVSRATLVSGDALRGKQEFSSPKANKLVSPKDRPIKVQYARPLRDIEFLQNVLDVDSASAVGQRTFDLTLRKQKGK